MPSLTLCKYTSKISDLQICISRHFTKVNSFDPSFAISKLTKKAIFARSIFEQKIEMHEKYQDRISDLLYYECVLGLFFKKKTYLYAEWFILNTN